MNYWDYNMGETLPPRGRLPYQSPRLVQLGTPIEMASPEKNYNSVLHLAPVLSHLSVCARDSDASIEAGPVVGLHNVPSVHLQKPTIVCFIFII